MHKDLDPIYTFCRENVWVNGLQPVERVPIEIEYEPDQGDYTLILRTKLKEAVMIYAERYNEGCLTWEEACTNVAGKLQRTELYRLLQIERELESKMGHAWLLQSEFDVYRYLIANTHGRLNGGEKAERHMNLVKNYLALWDDCRVEDVRCGDVSERRYVSLHDYTQTLTSHMDDAIGWPTHELRPDYQLYAEKFVVDFLRLANKWRKTR